MHQHPAAVVIPDVATPAANTLANHPQFRNEFRNLKGEAISRGPGRIERVICALFDAQLAWGADIEGVLEKRPICASIGRERVIG
jgi:hypothetical protein